MGGASNDSSLSFLPLPPLPLGKSTAIDTQIFLTLSGSYSHTSPGSVVAL